MVRRNLKIGVFALEALNAFATAYYFNWLFFYLAKELGVGDLDRLLFCAASGFIYMLGAWYGGRFGQRHGYFAALNLGFGSMAAALVMGASQSNIPGQLFCMAVWTLGMCFTWPALEALASEGETRPGLKQMIGIYNLVWASGAALGFFIGGLLVENRWLGWQLLFWLPAAVHGLQLVLVQALRWKGAGLVLQHRPPNPGSEARPDDHSCESDLVLPSVAKSFLRMAWLTNPFAYIAINTVIPLIPDLAKRFELSPRFAGVFCSTWLFARLGTFLLLWRWPRWHYRFGWMLGAYLLLMLSFVALLTVPLLGVVFLAQVIFGWAIGLIYYSSLFYSMDTSETKGVHGGVHESAIGLGIFAGPAFGAAGLRFFPQQPGVSAWTVGSVLLLGLVGIFWLRRNARRR